MDIRQFSRSQGKQSSTTSSKQLNKRHLVEPASLLKYPTGKAIFINPGYASRQEAYVPIIGRVKIPKSEAAISDKCEALWPKVRDRIVKRTQQQSSDPEIITQRRAFLEKLFALDAAQAGARIAHSPVEKAKILDMKMRKELKEVW